MPSREPRTVRVDPEVWSAFVSQVVEWEGQKRGELGRHVENALEEYVDHGQTARIESKVDELLERVGSDGGAAHTHKHTEASEKAERIAEELEREDSVIVHDDRVQLAIEEIAGADERTIEKYKRLLKRHTLAYEHPNTGSWTVEREQWVRWVESYVDNDPTADLGDVLDDYPVNFTEYDQLVTTVPGVEA